MNRKLYILVLLFAAWPVNNAFRLLMALESVIGWPFLFNEEDWPGIQWYLFFVGNSVSFLFIMWAAWLYMTGGYKRDVDVLDAFGAAFIVQISDIIHYIGWQRHCEPIIFIQGFVILFAALKLLDRQLKKRNGKRGKTMAHDYSRFGGRDNVRNDGVQ